MAATVPPATVESVKDDLVARYERLALCENRGSTPAESLLSYYKDVKDGLLVTFEGYLSSPEKLNDAIGGHCTILNCEIEMSKEAAAIPVVNRSDETDPPVFKVHDWIRRMLWNNRKGMQLKLTAQKDMECTLHLLKHSAALFKPPIIIRANIIRIQGGPSPEIDRHDFLIGMKRLGPYIICFGFQANVATMVRLKKGYPIEDLLKVKKWIEHYHLTQPILLSVHASIMKYSIDNLKILLKICPKLSLCVESSRPDNPIDLQDFIHMRNKLDRARVFYDIPTPELEAMFNRATTAPPITSS